VRLNRRSWCVLLAAGLCVSPPSLAVAQRGPAPTVTKMDPQVLALACAPSLAYAPPLADLQVTGGQDSFTRISFAPGDLITINAGTDNGIEVGQEFFTRRIMSEFRRPVSAREPGVVRTSGWIRVYAVDDKMSLATISHACETVDVGDYLEKLVLPTMPPEAAELGKPERDNYGRILIGTDRRESFAKGDFMVIDRGADHGITPGARFVVYRDRLEAKNFLYDLGEAVAVSVGPNSATLLVLVSRDAFRPGDYVAMRR
jgi:hypothetical protein